MSAKPFFTPFQQHPIVPRAPAARVHRVEDDDEVPLAPTPVPDPAAAPPPEVPQDNAQGEPAMPRGHYDRSKAKKRGSADSTPTPATPSVDDLKAARKKGRKKAKKAKVAKKRSATPTQRLMHGGGSMPIRLGALAPVSGPRFGVFDDGSVQIETEECRGKLNAGDASDLVAFIERLKAK